MGKKIKKSAFGRFLFLFKYQLASSYLFLGTLLGECAIYPKAL
jgi:hypothetical protein